MSVTARSAILRGQRAWATRRGHAPDRRGYLPHVALNLYSSLSEQARSAFERGAGGETTDCPARGGRRGRPAKMRALHSSSALVVNVFDYWTPRDKAILSKSLGLHRKVDTVAFEAQRETGLPGTPPNLDLELVLKDGSVVAIESKFTEWLTPQPKNGKAFQSKYFTAGKLHWTARGLPGCQTLAEGLDRGKKSYRYLHAGQLLKHALGLAAHHGDKFSLLYLYFDTTGAEAERHRAELADFSEHLDRQIRFSAMTYQQLFGNLRRLAGPDHEPYLAYLGERYFEAAA